MTEFLNIIKNQENERRDAENARKERDDDMRSFRRMLGLPHQ